VRSRPHKLTRSPAGVTNEDPQTVHGLVAAEQLEQQLPVGAQVDAVASLDRMLRWLGGAKQEPHGPECNGVPKVHSIAHLREVLKIGKELRDRIGIGLLMMIPTGAGPRLFITSTTESAN
jgi:hypothetical protein